MKAGVLVALVVLAVGVLAILIVAHAGGVVTLLIAVLLFVAAYGGSAWHAWRTTREPYIRPRRAIRWSAVITLLVAQALLASPLQALLHRNVGQAVKVTSGAMEPTIRNGDYLFVIPLDASTIRRDALIAWADDEGRSFLYRIAGLPGDTLAMRPDTLFRNGAPVSEPYVSLPENTAEYEPTSRHWGPLVVPSDHIFVLGDSRANSYDSRYRGPLRLESVIGRPSRIYFSLDPAKRRIRWQRIGRTL